MKNLPLPRIAQLPLLRGEVRDLIPSADKIIRGTLDANEPRRLRTSTTYDDYDDYDDEDGVSYFLSR